MQIDAIARKAISVIAIGKIPMKTAETIPTAKGNNNLKRGTLFQ